MMRAMKQRPGGFPRHGKNFRHFSMPWKKVFHAMEKTSRFFHALEKNSDIFPRYGKKFSTVWKTEADVRGWAA